MDNQLQWLLRNKKVKCLLASIHTTRKGANHRGRDIWRKKHIGNVINCFVQFFVLLCVKLPSHIPRDLTASLLRPCYDPGRITVAMDAAGTQRGRSEEPKDAQGRRPSANILNMHKTVAETLHSCWVLVRSLWDRSGVAIVAAAS